MVPCTLRGVNASLVASSSLPDGSCRSPPRFGPVRFIGEEKDQFSRLDQTEFPSSYFFDCPRVLPEPLRGPSESLVLETEPIDIVGKDAMPVARLERVDQAVLADECIGDEHRCAKEQSEPYEASRPEWRFRNEPGVLALETDLAARHEQFVEGVLFSQHGRGSPSKRGTLRPPTSFGTRGGND